MSFQKVTFMLLGITLINSAFQQVGRVESVRLCGRQLADLLNTICEGRGGFHNPRESIDESSVSTNKRSVIEILRPQIRRTDPETNEDAESASVNDEITFNFQSGVVDECCRKPCSFSTLVSYCADAPQSGSIDLEGILSPSNEGEPTNSAQDLSEFELQQISNAVSSASSSDSNSQVAQSSNMGHSDRPNLGLSNRSRPVFIVLSQASEEEDRTAGEYRF